VPNSSLYYTIYVGRFCMVSQNFNIRWGEICQILLVLAFYLPESGMGKWGVGRRIGVDKGVGIGYGRSHQPSISITASYTAHSVCPSSRRASSDAPLPNT
jgi:hypothetical protein